jgi:hypothetical protein
VIIILWRACALPYFVVFSDHVVCATAYRWS